MTSPGERKEGRIMQAKDREIIELVKKLNPEQQTILLECMGELAENHTVDFEQYTRRLLEAGGRS